MEGTIMDHVMVAFGAWLETFRLHRTMQTVDWAVPAVQTVHILAISLVFSSSMIMALRTVNLAGVHWSPARWSERLNRWIFVALIVLLLSGSTLIVGEPNRSLSNWVFQIKMVMVVLASLLTWLLARSFRRHREEEHGTTAEKLLAVGIVLVWMAVIAAGRWIAYAS